MNFLGIFEVETNRKLLRGVTTNDHIALLGVKLMTMP